MSGISIVPKGALFGKYVKALVVAGGDPMAASAYAEGQGPSWTEVTRALKAAVNPMRTEQGQAATLAYPIAFDYAEFVRPMTLAGRLAGARKVPFNTRLIAQSAGAGAAWVGEDMPIPVSAADFNGGEVLTFAKIASITIHTVELARSSAPNVELVLAADVARAAAFCADLALLDPANAGNSAKPAALTFGAAAIPSSGSSVSAIDADLRAALAVLNDSDIDLSTAVWMMAPKTAVFLSTVRGSGGANAYPLVSARGGFLLGLPVLASNAAPKDVDSPSEGLIVLVAASEVLLADDGTSTIDTSEHASLQMDDNPSAGAANVVSLWQNNLVGLKATRAISWKLRRPDAVSVISGINF